MVVSMRHACGMCMIVPKMGDIILVECNELDRKQYNSCSSEDSGTKSSAETDMFDEHAIMIQTDTPEAESISYSQVNTDPESCSVFEQPVFSADASSKASIRSEIRYG